MELGGQGARLRVQLCCCLWSPQRDTFNELRAVCFLRDLSPPPPSPGLSLISLTCSIFPSSLRTRMCSAFRKTRVQKYNRQTRDIGGLKKATHAQYNAKPLWSFIVVDSTLLCQSRQKLNIINQQHSYLTALHCTDVAFIASFLSIYVDTLCITTELSLFFISATTH